MYRALALVTCLSLGAVAAQAQIAAVPALLPPPVLPAEMPQGAPVATQGEVQVPVLKQSLQRGQTITADNLMLQSLPAAKVFASTITSAEELTGQQAVRNLEAGKPVNKLHVRVAPLVSRNQVVTLVYRKGGIKLTGSAQALDDGQLGQSIRVLNPATRSTLTGTVAADGSVDMN